MRIIRTSLILSGHISIVSIISFLTEEILKKRTYKMGREIFSHLPRYTLILFESSLTWDL